MKPEVLAQARRYYHHVLHGGTLRPSDVAFMVEALEEAANQREWVGLTDEEMVEVYQTYEERKPYTPYAMFRHIEAKLKEKNT
jgi:predicted TIM-barrel fold metal-dependent hydrolase